MDANTAFQNVLPYSGCAFVGLVSDIIACTIYCLWFATFEYIIVRLNICIVFIFGAFASVRSIFVHVLAHKSYCYWTSIAILLHWYHTLNHYLLHVYCAVFVVYVTYVCNFSILQMCIRFYVSVLFLCVVH